MGRSSFSCSGVVGGGEIGALYGRYGSSFCDEELCF
jgi:hypothetical protein